MKEIVTYYGAITGIIYSEYYENGNLKECILNKYNELQTEYGRLIPQYDDSEPRRKYTNSLSFHKNGVLKSISLQEQTNIDTSYGIIPAELITFYESGIIKRIFPLNGKITGYWTEENEFELAFDFKNVFPFGMIHEKIISIHFYESGEIKSITFWPNLPVSIESPIGDVEVRSGISFYPDGTLESFEPFKPTVVNTPLGLIIAYDTNAIGIHGDSNSICFDKNGNIKSLVTSTDGIEILDSKERLSVHEPGLMPSLLNNGTMDIIPLKITFMNGSVVFDGNIEEAFDLKNHRFRVIPYIRNLSLSCGDCSNCTACK